VIRIILQLSKSEALNQKQLQTYPALKVTLSEIIGSLILGLIRLIQPDNTFLFQLPYKTNKLIYEFIHYII
jgi:hypothetical protein